MNRQHSECRRFVEEGAQTLHSQSSTPKEPVQPPDHSRASAILGLMTAGLLWLALALLVSLAVRP